MSNVGPTPIALAITDLDVGGAEKSLVELALRLDQTKWAPTVYCLKPFGVLADRLQEAGIACESLQMRSAVDIPKAMSRWTRYLRNNPPSAMISFLFHANLLGRIVAKRAGVPIHISGVRIAERAASWHLWLDRWTRRWTDEYVCVSSEVASFVQERIGAQASKVSVIPNGVDLGVVDYANPRDLSDLGIGRDDLVLICLGRLHYQKGVDILLSALSLIRELAALHRLRLLFVGDGPMRQEAEQRVRTAGLESMVQFVGHQPAPSVWLKAGAGLVLASRWEGMPNAVLEGMAAGLPVIATRVEGTHDLVVPGETGWLVAPNDSHALADAISDWIRNGEQRRMFGQAGRERVESTFQIDRTVAAWEELLEREIGGSSNEK